MRTKMKELSNVFDLKLDFQKAYDDLRTYYETMIYRHEETIHGLKIERDRQIFVTEDQRVDIVRLNEKVLNLTKENEDLKAMINWAEMENRKEYM